MSDTIQMTDVLKYLYTQGKEDLAQYVLNELIAKPQHVCPTAICTRPHVGSGTGIFKPGPNTFYNSGSGVQLCGNALNAKTTQPDEVLNAR